MGFTGGGKRLRLPGVKVKDRADARKSGPGWILPSIGKMGGKGEVEGMAENRKSGRSDAEPTAKKGKARTGNTQRSHEFARIINTGVCETS